MEPENSIDVALIGASELYTGFNSPLAWEGSGFTSYSLTFSGVPGTVYRSMLTEYLKHQDPQLVIFEINAFMYSDEYLIREAKLHTWIDNIPWSRNKLETIRNYVPEEEKYSYFWKMSKYHENWKRPIACVKGFAGRIMMDAAGISYTKSFSSITEENAEEPEVYDVEFTPKSQKYLHELLEYCRQEQLENVLFIRFPHCLTPDDPEVFDQIRSAVEEYGYDFLNLESAFDEIGLDQKADFYNNNHLNIRGMQKFTPYLCRYICDNYDLQSDHPQKIAEQWDICAGKMHQVIEKCERSLAEGERKTYYETAAYRL